MESFLDLLKQPAVQVVGWVLGVMGWIVGVVSGWIEFKSYREQKRMEGAYRSLLEQAQRDWTGRYTEEQVADLTAQFRRLEAQIRREIPQQARRVFLEDQLDALTSSISEQYQQYTSLRQELDQTSEPDVLAPSIRLSVESEIAPKYLRRQRQQRLIYLFIIVIFITSLFPFITELIYTALYGSARAVGLLVPPDDFFSYLGGVVIAMYVAFTTSTHRLQRLILSRRWGAAFFSIFLLIIWLLTVWLIVFEPVSVRREWEIIGAILSLLPLSVGVRMLYLILRSLTWSGQ